MPAAGLRINVDADIGIEQAFERPGGAGDGQGFNFCRCTAGTRPLHIDCREFDRAAGR